MLNPTNVDRLAQTDLDHTLTVGDVAKLKHIINYGRDHNQDPWAIVYRMWRTCPHLFKTHGPGNGFTFMRTLENIPYKTSTEPAFFNRLTTPEVSS